MRLGQARDFGAGEVVDGETFHARAQAPVEKIARAETVVFQQMSHAGVVVSLALAEEGGLIVTRGGSGEEGGGKAE